MSEITEKFQRFGELHRLLFKPPGLLVEIPKKHWFNMSMDVKNVYEQLNYICAVFIVCRIILMNSRLLVV